MRRQVLGATLAGALALAAPAAASKTHFEGNVEGGGTVHFNLVKKDGKRKLTNFNWDEIPMSCTQGDTTSSAFFPTTKVSRDGTFHDKAFDTEGGDNATAKISGAFSNHYKKEQGTIRVSGSFEGAYTGCDTGVTHHLAAPA